MKTLEKIQYIKDNISITEILQKYWSLPNHNNRYKCCFHNGNDYNMSIKNNEQKAFCFVCGQGGDCVDIVKSIFSLSTTQAIQKIDEDFGLGLSKPLSSKQKDEIKKRQLEIALQKKVEKEQTDTINKAIDKLANIKRYLMSIYHNNKCVDEDIVTYAQSERFDKFTTARQQLRQIDWLYSLLLDCSNEYEQDIELCIRYGTDKLSVAKKIIKC